MKLMKLAKFASYMSGVKERSDTLELNVDGRRLHGVPDIDIGSQCKAFQGRC